MANYPTKNVGRKKPANGGIILIEQIYDGESGKSIKEILKAIENRLGDLQVITISESIEHGIVKADNSVAFGGQTVVLTAIPATGYELDEYSVVDADGESVEVTDGVFTMPSSDVVVSATFIEEQEGEQL